MTDSNILFIGMDVHKDRIGIAIAEGTNQKVRRYGESRSLTPWSRGLSPINSL